MVACLCSTAKTNHHNTCSKVGEKYDTFGLGEVILLALQGPKVSYFPPTFEHVLWWLAFAAQQRQTTATHVQKSGKDLQEDLGFWRASGGVFAAIVLVALVVLVVLAGLVVLVVRSISSSNSSTSCTSSTSSTSRGKRTTH